jgi:hypothetical protein
LSRFGLFAKHSPVTPCNSTRPLTALVSAQYGYGKVGEHRLIYLPGCDCGPVTPEIQP